MVSNAINFHALRAVFFFSILFQAYSGYFGNKILSTTVRNNNLNCPKQSYIFSYRGGATPVGGAEADKAEKLKGSCIGIDLGTTYRYSKNIIYQIYYNSAHRFLSVEQIVLYVLTIFLYSCVAVWKNGRVEVCPNEQGNRITPSYVAWTADGQRLVGDSAKNQASSNPTNTVFDVKRLIGRKFSDTSVQKDAKLLPYKSK